MNDDGGSRSVINAQVVPLRPGDGNFRTGPPLLREVIGGVLRRERRRQQRTLEDVATSAGVSTQYLSEIERGRKEPSSEVLAAVCAALGGLLVDLVGATHTELSSTGSRQAAPASGFGSGALLLVA